MKSDVSIFVIVSLPLLVATMGLPVGGHIKCWHIKKKCYLCVPQNKAKLFKLLEYIIDYGRS